MNSHSLSYSLSFQSMSSVFFLSLVVHILYYYGIMQWIVIKIGWLIQVLMGTTVCESVNAAASVFLGIVSILLQAVVHYIMRSISISIRHLVLVQLLNQET